MSPSVHNDSATVATLATGPIVGPWPGRQGPEDAQEKNSSSSGDRFSTSHSDSVTNRVTATRGFTVVGSSTLACTDNVAPGDITTSTSGSRELGRGWKCGGRMSAAMVLLLGCTLSCQLAGAAAWAAEGVPNAGTPGVWPISVAAPRPAVRAALLSVALLSQLPASRAWNNSGNGTILPSNCAVSCSPAFGNPTFALCNTTCYVSVPSFRHNKAVMASVQ